MSEATQISRIDPASSEDVIRSGLLKRVEVFNSAIDSISACLVDIRQKCEGLSQVFPESKGYGFGIDVHYNGSTHYLSRGRDVERDLAKYFERQAWKSTIDEIQILNVMGVEDSKKLRKQLEDGELPDYTVDNVMSVILGLGTQAKDFAKSAVREVFDFLTPIRSEHKTNSAFRVGRRAIIRYGVEKMWGGGFRVSYSKQDRLRAMDGVFHILDGKGPMVDGRGPLIESIQNGKATGETNYFRWKCFKNQNLHIEFRRLDLVKELNFVAAGERVLGSDE